MIDSSTSKDIRMPREEAHREAAALQFIQPEVIRAVKEFAKDSKNEAWISAVASLKPGDSPALQWASDKLDSLKTTSPREYALTIEYANTITEIITRIGSEKYSEVMGAISQATQQMLKANDEKRFPQEVEGLSIGALAVMKVSENPHFSREIFTPEVWGKFITKILCENAIGNLKEEGKRS